MVKILLGIRNKKPDISYSQSGQVYIQNNDIYCFDRQKIFKARYLAKNNILSQKYKRYDKKNMGYKSLLLLKSNWNPFYYVISL